MGCGASKDTGAAADPPVSHISHKCIKIDRRDSSVFRLASVEHSHGSANSRFRDHVANSSRNNSHFYTDCDGHLPICCDVSCGSEAFGRLRNQHLRCAVESIGG